MQFQSESDPTKFVFLLFLVVRCLMMTSSSLLSSSLGGSSLFVCLLLFVLPARLEEFDNRLPVVVRLLPRPVAGRVRLLFTVSGWSSFVSNNENRSLNFFFCESLHTCCTCCNACCILSWAKTLISAGCCLPSEKRGRGKRSNSKY